MIKKICKTLAVAGVLSLPALAGEQQDWQFSFGVSYRAFDDVDLDTFSFRNSGTLDPAVGPLGIQGFTDATFAAIAAPQAFSVSHVQFSGEDGDVSGSDSFAPVITAEKIYSQKEGVTYSLIANLQYYMMDVSGDGNSIDAVNYSYIALPAPAGIAPAPLGGPFAGLAAGDSVSASVDFEMDLLVLDLGVKASKMFGEKCNGYISGGPTLNLSMIDTSVSESASWTPVTAADTGSYSSSADDDETGLNVGLYAAVGTKMAISETVRCTAEIRYDIVAGTPGTDQAELDLDSFSAQLKLIWDF